MQALTYLPLGPCTPSLTVSGQKKWFDGEAVKKLLRRFTVEVRASTTVQWLEIDRSDGAGTLKFFRMVQSRISARRPANGDANGYTNGFKADQKHVNGNAKSPSPNETGTDLSRWRLLDERGRLTWHYLRTDDEVKEWPQTIADKHFLGLATVWVENGSTRHY